MNDKIKIKPKYLVIFGIILIIVCIFIGIKMNSGGDVSQVSTSFTVTDNHSAIDIEAAMRVVKRYFRAGFTGCTLTELCYEGESMAEKEALYAAQYNSQDAIVLLSTFQTEAAGGDGNLEPNAVYSNYQWLLVKNPLGQWTLKTWGYG
ncbi:MAG: hypothetical protein LJU34_07275 [Oscillospiraceae bacterium]|nr:hypothetical protein [Oscillospiraceae bacterium]